MDYEKNFGEMTLAIENDDRAIDYDDKKIRTSIVHARQDIGASGAQLIFLNITLSSIRTLLWVIIVILGTLTAKVLGLF